MLTVAGEDEDRRGSRGSGGTEGRAANATYRAGEAEMGLDEESRRDVAANAEGRDAFDAANGADEAADGDGSPWSH